METIVVECCFCHGKRTKFQSLCVRNVDQVYEVRMCLLCGAEFEYTQYVDGDGVLHGVSTGRAEARDVSQEEIIEKEDLELGVCSRCGKNGVLPDEWVAICPDCLFKKDFLT